MHSAAAVLIRTVQLGVSKCRTRGIMDSRHKPDNSALDSPPLDTRRVRRSPPHATANSEGHNIHRLVEQPMAPSQITTNSSNDFHHLPHGLGCCSACPAHRFHSLVDRKPDATHQPPTPPRLDDAKDRGKTRNLNQHRSQETRLKNI